MINETEKYISRLTEVLGIDVDTIKDGCVAVIGSSGYEAINLAKGIIENLENGNYETREEIERDIQKVQDLVEFYNFWD